MSEDGPKEKSPGEKKSRSPFTIILLLGLGATFIFLLGDTGNDSGEITWTEMEAYLSQGHGVIDELILYRGDWELRGKWGKNGPKDKGDGFTVKVPNHETFITPEFQKRAEAAVEKFDTQDPSRFWEYLLPIIPWVILIGLFWFIFIRQMRGGGGTGGVLAFGKSKAKMHSKGHVDVTFEDVAGIEEAKEEVQEIVAFLKNPARFEKLGGRVPKGALLVGAPGTGKTLLAKAIAGEAGVPFFAISGSDFVEMFVGVGASRVRDLFKQARENSPCIIFLDEIDAVGRKRGAGLGGGHDEREQTLNAILVEMDGFDTDEGIIILAATNRPDILDPALLRPGRFDRQIVVDMPDLKGREAILRVHARGIKVGADVDLKVMGRGTPGFSGADLEAVMNEAALSATMKHKDFVEMEDLEEARDKVRWGRQKRSRVVDAEDRRVTAFHEAGHALVAHYLPKAEPIHKVTIIPRGRALGATMQLPERDRYCMGRERLYDEMKVLFSGRLAEEMFCDDITSGAQNDIERSTEIARRMVTEWGMSEKIGPINFREGEETLFLGKEVARSKSHSEQVALEIDQEVKRIVTECYDAARVVLEDHRAEVEALATALIKYEVLNGEEVAAVLRGDTVDSVRSKAKARKAAAAAERSTEAQVPESEDGGDDSDDADDLETKGRFAY